MRERLTARILLFDPQDRLLLMKGRLPSGGQRPGAWFTVGGGAEPGESVLQAAAREVVEETGFEGVELGPVVWLRDAVLSVVSGELMLFKEHYVVGRCAGGEPCRDGWADYEHEFVDELRWWTLEELRRTDEPVFPPGLADLLPDILAGRYPAKPRAIP